MLDHDPYRAIGSQGRRDDGDSEQRLHFATGNIPLIEALGHRFVRIADRTSEAPMGLWIVC